MISKLLRVLVFLAVASCVYVQQGTMRLDYFHTGNSTQEIFSVDRIVLEPLPWPGNPAKLLDDTNLGAYFFEVRDKADGRLLYSRGFSSIFGEWVTTDEAKTVNRPASETQRSLSPATPLWSTRQHHDDSYFSLGEAC